MGDTERLTRIKQRAPLKRDAAASHLEAIYTLGLSAFTDSSVIPKFLIASEDIYDHWATFTLEIDTMLEAMIELGTDSAFSNNFELEVRNTLLNIKALAIKFHSSSEVCVAASDTSNNDKPGSEVVNDNVKSVSSPTAQVGPVIASLVPSGSNVQLPKIPLPTFDGRLQNWPDFTDRFNILVGNRSHLSNIEKFYYLLGCLQPGPTDVVKGITVSEGTYELAWSREAQAFKNDLIHILSQFGLELKKWASNSTQLLENIPLEDRAAGSLPFNIDNSPQVQILGMKWNPDVDTFNYNVSSTKFVSSKRSMLSVIARIFDPLGFLSPVIFHAKHQLQCVWRSGVSWDDRVPLHLENSCMSFVNELHYLSRIQVPRFVGTSEGAQYELCGSSDASAKGYAAVVYLKVSDCYRYVSMFLLGSKTKLALTKAMSIPRLELCAAGLLVRWLSRIQNTLATQISIQNVYAWSDSSVVLSWLNTPHVSYKIFVSNRVHKINEMLPSCRWFYVSTEMNPADCASRGLRPCELAQHDLYWKGPTFRPVR